MNPTNPLTGLPVAALPLEDVFGRSGLEFLKDLVDGRLPMPPIAAIIPLAPVEAEEGRVVFRAKPDASFLNPIGSIHAGYTATLLDTAMACAVQSTLRAGEAYTTLEFKVSLHRPLQPDTGEIRVEGKILSRGRRVASSEGRVTDSEGRLMASATTSCLIMAIPGRENP